MSSKTASIFVKCHENDLGLPYIAVEAHGNATECRYEYQVSAAPKQGPFHCDDSDLGSGISISNIGSTHSLISH